MPLDEQTFEATDVPTQRFIITAAAGFAGLLVCLGGVFALYLAWVNGPQAPVRPAPLANASAPALETQPFRRPPPPTAPEAGAQSYRWRDAAHDRVEIPIDRAMAMVAARGSHGFDPIDQAPTPLGGRR